MNYMNEISNNILVIIIGILIFISVIMFMRLIIFIKKGFVIMFKNMDIIFKKTNDLLDSPNKEK